jgi:hypothetical protein
MAAMKVALVMLIGGKWKVSYYATADEANAVGNAQADLEEGWVLTSLDDFLAIDDISVANLQSLYNFLAPKKANIGQDVDEAKEKVWGLLSKKIGGKAAPAPEPEEETGEEEVEPEEDNDDTQTEEAELEATAETTAPARGKRAAKKAAKPAAKEAPKKAAKPAAAAKTTPAKPAAKAPAKKAAAATNGIAPARGVSAEWKKVFAAIQKTGDEGMSVADMKAVCEKNGIGAYYRRFEVAGFLKRVERGSYALTSTGAKAAGL